MDEVLGHVHNFTGLVTRETLSDPFYAVFPGGGLPDEPVHLIAEFFPFQGGDLLFKGYIFAQNCRSTIGEFLRARGK